MNALTNDGIWGSTYEAWVADMTRIDKGYVLNVYLGAVPFIHAIIQETRDKYPVKGDFWRSQAWKNVRTRELSQPVGRLKLLTAKELDELMFFVKEDGIYHLSILHELLLARIGTKGLREINSPKGAAKLVREELAKRQAEADAKAAREAKAEAIENGTHEDEEEVIDTALNDLTMNDERDEANSVIVRWMRGLKNPNVIMDRLQSALGTDAMMQVLDRRMRDVLAERNQEREFEGKKPISMGQLMGKIDSPMQKAKKRAMAARV